MKKIITTALALLLLIAPKVALSQEELTVYDGTATNGYVPIYGYYSDAYLKAEIVYPAGELVEMDGATINSMTFYASQVNVNWGTTFRVFLLEVVDETISAFVGSGTIVYEGQLVIAGNEMIVEFTTPYEYNGGNLLVGFYQTNTGTYITSSWYGVNVNGASVQGYSYNGLDAISATQHNFLPKTTFGFTPGDNNACEKPVTIGANNVTAHSVELGWTGGSGIYDVEYKRIGNNHWLNYANSLSDTTITISNLIHATDYQVRVRSVCNDGVSGWKVLSFSTDVINYDHIYVTENGMGDGGTWETATKDLQWALYAAERIRNTYGTATVVWVAAGTYYGDTTDVNAFTMVDGVNVYGGFVGNEPADFDLFLRDFEANETILDGQNARRVLCQTSIFNTLTIWNGFTIRNGNGPIEYSTNGGGVFIYNNVELSQCVICNNSSWIGGGVCSLDNSVVSNCRIQNNTAVHGGGIFLSDNSVVSNCQITNNTAEYGGGVYAYISMYSSIVSNCLIANNAAYLGGGIFSDSAMITNSTVVRNVADTGAGVYGINGTIFINSIAWGNGENEVNNISGVITCSYSAIEGGYSGDNNMALLSEQSNQAPLFVNPSPFSGVSENIINADWHLQQGSVCVNRGVNTAVMDSLDMDGLMRIMRDTVDLGCYESDYYSVPKAEYESIIYVTVTGAGNRTGENWDNAISSIKDAQALAVTHAAKVWVAAGTYYGDTATDNAFTMRDGVNVYGGFEGNEPVNYDLSQRDFETNNTILDGDSARRVLCQLINFNQKTTWDGFTIQNGLAMGHVGGGGAYLRENGELSYCTIRNNNAYYIYGGGVLADNYSTVSNCIIINNNAGSGGGVEARKARVYNCQIENNTANDGGGVRAYNASVHNCQVASNTAEDGGGVYSFDNSNVSDCHIVRNTANQNGGGVFAIDTKITNCHIEKNTANDGGGGYTLNTLVSNCLIANNMAVYSGGGINSGVHDTVTNSTIVRNAANTGAGIYQYSSEYHDYYMSSVFINSLVWGNNGDENNNVSGPITFFYSAIEGGYEGDNIVTLSFENPPLFINPSLSAGTLDSTTNVDWHLQQGSPCINRGNNDVVTDSIDLDGNPRIEYDTVDMGCYEFKFDVEPVVQYDSIIYVTVTGAGTHSGNSWANATSSIDSAQTLAEEHNAVVWVAAGTYYGDTTSTNAFTMHDGVSVYGGFAGGESADYDLNQRDFEINATILDGQNVRRVLLQTHSFNKETIWDGFTIQHGLSYDGAGANLKKNAILSNCLVTDNQAELGGGVNCSEATLLNCTIVNNTIIASHGLGGGVYAYSSQILNCKISNNSSNYYAGGVWADTTRTINCIIQNNTTVRRGGGIFVSNGSEVLNCVVSGNSTTDPNYINEGGGGVYSLNSKLIECEVRNNNSANEGGGLFASSSMVSRCTINHNRAYSGGGGAYLTNFSTISNCLIFNNQSRTTSGSGIRVNGGGSIHNSTVVNNKSEQTGYYGYAIWCSGSTVPVSNCIIFGNESASGGSGNFCIGATFSYCAIEGGSTGASNFALNEMYLPLFVNPTLTAGISDTTLNADWHLLPGSPCINRGDNATVTDSLDLDGSTRIKWDTVDLGCYETDYHSIDATEYDSIIYVTVSGSGTHSGNSWENATSSIREAMALAQAYNANVWVAAGTYYGDTTSSYAFTMVDGANVYGGFAGNEPSNYDLSLRDLDANATILDGQEVRGVLYQYSSFMKRTEWDGFTIQNGMMKNGSGGGVHLRGNVTLSRCVVTRNTSNFSGGGIDINGTDVVVSNCLVSNNKAKYGGGVAADYGIIENTTIVRNVSTSGYGGIRGYSSGSFTWYSLTLNNSIIWGNKNNSYTNNVGGNIYCSYSAIEGGFEGDSIIVLSDENPPLFVNPSIIAGISDNTENIDWHLQQGSPCINRGNNELVADSLDLDGTARIKRDTVDLGCYESDYYNVPVLPCSTVYHEYTDTACDTYTWNDHPYTQSGDYNQTFLLDNGCDSIVTLHLTVNHSVTTHEYLTTCASDLPYAYKDTLLDVSTPQLLTINSHLLTQNGCDSTVVLQLTVLPSTVGEFATMTPTDNYPLTSYPIHFTWDAVENASGYELYVWPVGEPQPQQPTAANIYGTSYVLHTLPNRANYQWMMKAYNACDTSESIVRQFSLNVTPSLTVNANNPIDFGEVQLNSARSVFFQVNGIALDSAITYQLTGADTAAFSLAPTNTWNSMSGGRMQLTFHPQTLQNEFTAQMTIQSNDLVRTFTVKGYLADFLTFTTYVDSNVYAMDSDIPVHGQVINALNEPVPGLDVEVYVKVMDYTRTYPATSDANGQFTIMFTPQHSEAGYYTVGSRRAGSNSSAVHDDFNIPGMMLVSSDNILWEPTIDQPDSGTIAVRNRSQIPLTNIQVTPVSLPNGCTVQFASLSLDGMATGELQYTVSGSQISTGVNYEEVRLNAVSNEGAAMSFTAWYYCLPQRADLDVTPTSLTTTMTRGKSKVVDFKIYNNGTGPTGNIYVSLPDVPWMSVVGNDTLPSLAVHDSAYVSIRLSADSTTALVRYTGNIAVTCERGEGVSIPYDITAISDSTGTLVVDVTDEYTWNTNNGHGPHLAGANVIVKGYYSLETVATGVTDANGLFVVNDLPEGYYKLIVRADRHAEYQGNLLVTASDTNRQDIFIQFQAITYSWEVVPTEIEDEYTYELNVEFETHVPKPVVVLDMPENIPALEEGESFTFDYVLTNYGLVSTYDVQLFTPENEEYTFTPLINYLDSLPAQTTVVIPCVMSRNVSPQPVMLAHHSESANTSKSSKSQEPCQYMIVSQTLSYYSCAGEQRPIEAYVVRYIGNVPCTTYPTNTSNSITFYPTNPPVYSGGSSSSWNSGGNDYYVVPPITIPLDSCECQDIVNRDTTIIYDMDTVLFINGTDDYNFVAFCDSCDSMVIICTTINNCITGEITYYCDTLSSLGPDTMGSGQGGGPEPPAPDSTNCKPKSTKIWGGGYYNQLLSDRGFRVEGVVADGVSQMVIQISSACHFGYPVWSLDYQGQSDSRYTGTIISENRRNDTLFEFIYRAPEDFPLDVNKEYVVNFVVQISVGDTSYKDTVPIYIIRPPVILVHGLFGNKTAFETLYYKLLKEKMYFGWQLMKVDYEQTNTASFENNTYVINRHLDTLFRLITKQGYVVSKADIIGHSMGGILARLHVQYVNRENVHKIITLNTPHYGSQLANFIQDNRYYHAFNNSFPETTSFIFKWLQAVLDLQVTSPAIRNYLNNPDELHKMNGIPIHAVTSTSIIQENNIAEFRKNHPFIYAFLPNDYKNNPVAINDYLRDSIYGDQSDLVVSLISQRGGLEGVHQTTFSPNDISACHIFSKEYSPILEKLSELLKLPSSSVEFCKTGFNYDTLNYPPIMNQHDSRKSIVSLSRNEDLFDVENQINSSVAISATYDNSNRCLTIVTNHSPNVEIIATMVICHNEILDFDNVDTLITIVPEIFKGSLRIYSWGHTVEEEFVLDSTIVMINDCGTTPQSISFIEDTLYLIENFSMRPSLVCAWANGDTTYITPTYSADSSIVSVENDVVRGIHAGTTELIAQFEGLTASIPVVVYGWDFDDDNNSGGEDDSLTHNTVCATVTVQFSQKMTMTREAFEGTLTINNGHESNPMQNIDVDFVIKDENGVDCTNLFQINFLSYNNMTGTNGNASLDAQNTGNIVVQFIPTKQAAPEIAKQYAFGGSFSFIDPFTGESMTYNLYPVDIMVNPSPDLYVNYFMQRDILGDDPLTENRVEPIIPAELGVIIHNRGAGIAKNVLLETAEPRIIDNDKGLAVDFAMYGAAFNGQERQLGLMEIPFGNIEPNHTGVGEWWFASTLLGHFVSYEAHVIHNNSFGNPDLSLVSSLDIHPLIHTVYAYGNLDDGINDFLVDDVEDSQNYPDSLYFSNGSSTGVATADSIGFDHYVIPMDTIVILTLDPSRIGWNYEQTWDPGRGQYKLISCTRNSDQQEIPLSNVWQTHVTLPVGADPIYENKLHIVDTLSNDLPTTYTLVFSLKEMVLEVDTILNVPENTITTPLSEVTVKFNKPIVDSTFDYQDMTLKCNNGENLLDASMVVERIDSMTYNLHLNNYTQQSGLFVLNIQTLDIMDAEGYNGYYAEQAQWIQALTRYEDLHDTVCDSTDYAFHGDYLNASGLYFDTLRNVLNTYDSVVYRLQLSVNYTTTSDTTAVACDNFTWHGVTYSESGDCPFILTNTNGCDSVVTLHLTVNYSNTGDTTAVACDSYDWYEHTGITTSGEYTHTFTNASGCDSVVTLHLTVNYSNIGDTTAVACDSFDWYEHTGLTTSGDYTHTFTNTSGCDSVVTLHLTVNYSNTGDTSAVACGSFDWYGETLTETAEYTRIFTNASGCDSVVTLHLTINNPVHTAVTATACESFLWNGTLYTQSGTYTYGHPDANGCTQVDTLHLTIHNPIHTAVSETSCESFLWNGTTYTQSGIYTYSHPDANGCTQVDTLHLTIHNPVHTAVTESACESFTWNGTTYTQSGTYTHGHLDANGCTQVDTLHLTINNPVHTAVTEIACASFIWNGILYTQSGTYTFSHLDANGCTQVDTLHLTIHNPVHTAVTETACESFTWNGITYTQSGTYTHGHLDANGCTQVDTLHLIIHNPVHIAVTETACESFTWNGIAYTQSGTYTFSHLDVNGCTQVDTLHLIIHNPVHTAVTETSCVSFLWNGTLYTQSGTYTFSHLDVNGCTQVDTLHLTIYNPVHTAVSETACANFVWNGISYTQSGAYTQGHLDANGCTQVDTLHLTINQPTTGDTTAVACDNFTWNGNTYTQSGDYTSYLTNVAGCDSVVTLHLTINSSNAVDTTVFACESFTWNGTTYTESGDYTTDQTNAAGCDSVVTLHLTIADAPALQAISGETEICLNQFATYTYDISEPDYQYRWFKDNALWAENVPQVTLHEMGEGSVLLTMSVADEQNGCAADTSLLVQVVNRIAPDTTEIRRKGSTNILICQPVTSSYGEVHYRWGYTNRFTYNEATMPGDHNYCLYDFGIDTLSYFYWVETYLNNPIGEGCDNRSYYGHSVLTSTSDYDANTVEAYMSRDHIILYVSALSPENVSASLYDVNGKLLLTRGYGITDVVSDAIAVNIAPGVYFLSVSIGNEFYSFKLLKL